VSALPRAGWLLALAVIGGAPGCASSGGTPDAAPGPASDAAAAAPPDAGAGDSHDGAAAAPAIFSPLPCDAGGAAPTGRAFPVGSLQRILPACPGRFIAAAAGDDAIALVDGSSGQALWTRPLPWAPTSMSLDPARGHLYVASRAAAELVRIALRGDEVRRLTLAQPVIDLAVTDPGKVFLILARDGHPDGVTLVDGETGAPDPGPMPSPSVQESLVTYEPAHRLVIMGETASSGGTVTRYRLGVAPATFDLVETYRANGFLSDLVLSPDGAHLVAVSGAGNLVIYALADFDATDMRVVRGHWRTGPYPSAAAFSPDNRLLAASDGTQVLVYTVDTHEFGRAIKLDDPALGCARDIIRLAWSRDGQIIHVLSRCSLGAMRAAAVTSLPYPGKTP
jgi:hypothetical protein